MKTFSNVSWRGRKAAIWACVLAVVIGSATWFTVQAAKPVALRVGIALATNSPDLHLVSSLAKEHEIKSDSSPAVNSSGLPVCHCERIQRDITLSGKVDDPLWQQAQPIQLTRAADGQAGRYRTTVRMLYCSRYLYLAFECEDELVWGTLTKRDSDIYGEECVEAFICPSGKPRQYYEINVSPRNTVFDAFILNGRPRTGEWTNFLSWKEFTCDQLVTRVHINGALGARGAKGWSVEYAIPFASIVGADNLFPQSGEEWRINFYRIDAPEVNRPEFYAWSTPGVNDFHLPWRFGRLRFK